MASISIAMLRGVDGFQLFATSGPTGTGIPAAGSFVIGTAAPTSPYDFELRINTTDQNSANVNKKDVQLALRAFDRILMEQLQQPAGTFMFPGFSGV
jgi:hypothetical protein